MRRTKEPVRRGALAKVISVVLGFSQSVWCWLFTYLGSLKAQWQRICLQCKRCRRHRFEYWVGKILWRRGWQPTLVLLPGECHGQRRLAGYRRQGCKGLDTTEATEYAHTFTYLLKRNFRPRTENSSFSK